MEHAFEQKALEQKLAEALDALERGENVEEILQEEPALASELRPYLETAQALGEMPLAPRPGAAAASRRAMLEAAASERETNERGASTPPTWRRLFFSFAAAAVLLMIAGGLLAAPVQQAVPGDALYPVKRAAEDVRLFLAPPAQKEELRQAYAEERNHEVYVMLDNGRDGVAGYTGEIKALGRDTWEVGHITVQITEDTVIEGDPDVGDYVEAHCLIKDGKVYAESLAVLPENPTADDE